MIRKALFYAAAVLLTATAFGQTGTDSTGEIYRIHPAVDIPATAAAVAWDLYGFSQVSQKPGASQARVEALSKNNIPWFDRWAVRPYNRSVDKLSYVPFYVAMPLPLIVFGLDKKTRKDFWKLTFLYGEAMTMTGVLYTSATHYVNRFRPLVYSSESPMNVRTTGNARNAFFAGHVALVGTSVFFVARVLDDYHPDSHLRWLYYGLAAAMTGVTGYLRHRAGEHFPSDIALGTAVGTASGLLTPSLHRIGHTHPRLTILPFSGQGHGLAAFYRL